MMKVKRRMKGLDAHATPGRECRWQLQDAPRPSKEPIGLQVPFGLLLLRSGGQDMQA